MKLNVKPLVIASVSTLALALSACGSSAGEEGGGGSTKAAAEDILAMPSEIDDSDGLVIDGELIADADLLKEARSGDPVVWYTGSGEESAQVTADRFEAETGVKIEMTRMPSSKLVERVLSENGAGRLGADVLLVTDPILAQQLADEGVFSRFETASYSTIKDFDAVVQDDGLYYMPYYSAYSFSYNNAAVSGDDVPKDWEDLLDPKWKGKIGIVAAGAGGTVQGLADFQERHYGTEYWEGLAALDPVIYDTTSVQLEAMARGEIVIGTSGFNSTYGAEAAGAPITLAVPPGGISGTMNMQGLTTAGEDSPAAKVFMNWSMSSSGERFAAAQGFVAGRPDIPETKTGPYQLPKADDPSFEVYTPEDAAARGEDIVNRWNQVFGYTG